LRKRVCSEGFDPKGANAEGSTTAKEEVVLFEKLLRRWGAKGYAVIADSGLVTKAGPKKPKLRLNPHYHSIVFDGVFVQGDDGGLEFHALPSISNTDVAELLQAIRVAIAFSPLRARAARSMECQ
jgi:hypothetical protein